VAGGRRSSVRYVGARAWDFAMKADLWGERG
jgi:hypothetical protein